VAEDPTQPVPLRARARYLEGNLLFLTADYEEAVKAYDKALELAPGMGDAGPIGSSPDGGHVTYAPDPIGRDAAWNRAVALRRIEDKKDAGQDAAPNDGDGGGDDQNQNQDGGDGRNDAGNDDDKKDGGGNDDKKDAGNEDAGDDSKKDEEPPKDEPDAAPPPPPPPSRQSQDDRILDQLENAPTVQQEAAKKRAQARKVRGMADK
jgi:tetratricopeptide (TPR) repeat protein